MPRQPEAITMWKTSDGHTHDTELAAQHHQQFLDLVARIENQLELFYYEGMSTHELAAKLADLRVEMRAAYGL